MDRAGELAGRDAARSDTAPGFATWGEYAASLAVPACTGALDLEVNTTTTELDGGATLSDPAQAGATLSIVEALQIAANRTERVAIHFAPAVFAAESPGKIAFGTGCTLPTVTNACVDGRVRGVILDFGGATSACRLDLGADALVVGVELHRLTWQVNLQAGAQIAGCRINSDGQQATPAKEPETVTATTGSTVGPGNSFGNTEGVRIKYAGLPVVRGNYFGLDPVTGVEVFNQFGIDLGSLSECSGTLLVEDNVFRSWTGIFLWMGTGASSSIVVRRNELKAPAGVSLSGAGVLSQEGFLGGLTIGPDNTFRGYAAAIQLDTAGSGATLTRNSISGCQQAIVLANAKVTPPTISKATATFVEGACSGSGTIEVFEDSAGQAATYLGSTACAGGSWRHDSVITGPLVTATLTTAAGTSALSTPVTRQ